MTRIEFEQLSEPDQIRIISRYGVFLAEKIASGNRLYLYTVNTFYVELLHNLADVNNKGLEIVRVFDDTRYLTDYIQEIDVTHLYA